MAKKPIQKKVKKDKELNYNDYSINLSPNFVGDGYNTIGRNYSPAWGGQFQMGGNLPGSVGMMYARTNSPAPSNGPYAKKTKASAQNGKEMKFYQEGLDFRPKTISKKGSKIIKDPRGQWAHPGKITEIPSNEITMQGVNYPVLGVSNTGDTQMMYPNQDYVYEGDSVIEYPMMQKGGRTPIFTDNPNDSRLRAYTDSLNLYNRGKKAFVEYNSDEYDVKDYKPDKNWGKTKVSKKDIIEAINSTKEMSGYSYGSPKNFKERVNLLNKSLNTGIYPTNMIYPQREDPNLIYKKPLQPIIYKKSEPKKDIKKEETKQESLPVVQSTISTPQTNYNQGTPVYASTPYANGPGAFVGYETPQGDTVFIKPEDYGRMGVPYYGKEFIQKNSKKKMEDGGSIQDRGQLKKLDQLTNFTNYNDMAKAKTGKKIKKAQMGMNALTGIGSSLLGAKGGTDNQQAGQIGNILGGLGSIFTGGSGNFGGMSGNQLGSQALDLFGGSGTAGKIMNVGPAGALGKGGAGFAKGLGAAGLGLVDSAGDIMKGFGEMKQQKQNIKKADQYAQVTGLTAQAAEMRPEKVRRKYVRPEDTILQPEQMAPSYGGGSNFLAAEFGAQIGGNQTEIQNMYNPGTLYDDLGYEPLNDTDVKQFRHGGHIPTAEFGDYFQSSGQASIGKGVGSAIGTAFFGPVGGMVGGLLGGVAGNALGGAQDAEKLRGFQKQAEDNTLRAAYQQTGQNIQNQYSSFMEDGGYVSNDWQPQVLAKFGEYDVKDLFAPDRTMNTLRSGGHITQNYTFPQDQFQMGGELQTHWGGYAEPISQNPYLPGTGETVMFRGQSHEETNGKGQSGIGVTYGDNPVEVERGEPAIKMEDGGEQSMVVYGNMQIPKYGVEALQDPKAKGKKFKNYINDISKTEAKQNKIIDKSTERVNNLDVYTPFDGLEMNALQANLIGADMKLKNIAQKKQTAAQVQNAILDTAEELGLESDALAKGQIKKAKFGAKLQTAQDGTEEFLIRAKQPGYIDYNAMPVSGNELWNKDSYSSKWIPKVKEAFNNPTKARDLISRLENYGGQDAEDVKNALKKGKTFEEKKNIAMRLATDKKVGPYHKIMNDLIDIKRTPAETIIDRQRPTLGGFEPKGGPIDFRKAVPEEKQKGKFNWRGLAESAISNLNPLFRPTDQEPLDPSQLMAEQYALATNQLEPVQAQSYKPLLEQPFDISLQDQLNANQADFNAIQRTVRNNPAALSALAAQKYGANSGVLGNQFRMNQAERAGVYNRNRGTLNDAQLKNLTLYDQQYTRQAQAKTNTKQQAQAALSSISDKMAKNRLENKTLGIYENLYNYRFGPKGQAINYNDPAQFNLEGNPFARPTTVDTKKSSKEDTGKYGAKIKSRNGSIVKAIKNL
jgi:hypothetical protein